MESVGDQKQDILSYINDKANELRKIKGNNQGRQKKWDDFVRVSPFQNVDSYIVMKLWKKTVHVRRRPLRLEGIRYPTLPTEEKEEKQMMARIIGQWDSKHPFVAGGDPTTIAKKIDEGAIPIGKIYITQSGGRNYLGRQVDISTALYSLTVNAVKNSLFKPAALNSEFVNIQFGIFGDGVPACGHSNYVGLVYLIWDPSYSEEVDERWADEMRLFPVIVCVSPEKADHVLSIWRWMQKDAKSVKPLFWANTTFKYNFHACSADHSGLQKLMNNIGGSGHRRCVVCGFDFSKVEKLWDLASHFNAPAKDLVSLAKALIEGNGKAPELGVKGIPSILPDSVQGLQQLLEDTEQLKWAEEFLIAFDSLHNLKGDYANLLARMRCWKEWDDDTFQHLLEEHVQRRLVSELDGAHYRLLIVLWDKVVLPSLHSCTDTEKIERIKQLFHHMTEIQAILYLPPEARQEPILRLRLHVLLFLQFVLCRHLFPDRKKSKRGVTVIALSAGTLPTIQQAQAMTKVSLRDTITAAVSNNRQKLTSLAKAVTPDNPRTFSKLTKPQILLVLGKLLESAESTSSSPTAPAATTSPSSSSPTAPATTTSLSSSSSPTAPAVTALPSSSSPTVDTVMGLFLHSKIAHLGTFFESMDLKNVSTERGEGFNYFLKWVLRHFSSHNLETVQPFREVLIRWTVGIPLFETYYECNTTISRISREFKKQHTFAELSIDMDAYATDLDIFLPYLDHWEIKDDGASQLIFKTLAETIKIFQRYD